jgi:gamma-glutamyltranspeptidase / glutathione hydrolase
MRSTLDQLRRTLCPVSSFPPIFFTLYSWVVCCLAVQARGGIITLQDLKNYTALTRTPVNITYRGNRIFSTVAPSSGTVVLSALKVFEAWPGSAPVGDPTYDITTHRLIQATRFGYGQRTWYGDPAYTANVSALERLSDSLRSRYPNAALTCIDGFREFLEDSTVRQVRALINDSTTYPAPYVRLSASNSLGVTLGTDIP